MSEIEEEQKKEDGKKIAEDAKLVELKNKMDEDMRRLNFQVELNRSTALDKTVGVKRVHQLRDVLLQTIADQKAGDIRITFAALDWIYRYYHHMNKICKTGIDDFLDLDLK